MLNNKRIDNDIRVSNAFNNYFVSIGSTLASKINDNSCNPLDYIKSNVKSMAIPIYTENDVTLVINSLNNSSPGWDNIPALLAKQVIIYYRFIVCFPIGLDFLFITFTFLLSWTSSLSISSSAISTSL